MISANIGGPKRPLGADLEEFYSSAGSAPVKSQGDLSPVNNHPPKQLPKEAM